MEMCALFCCLGTTDWKETELDSHGRHSNSRIAANCDGHPDHVWTWILVCKYFLESSWSLHSYTSNLSPYHVRVGRNHYFSAETFSANSVVTPYFGPLGRVSC
jgi:hypothetical protein